MAYSLTLAASGGTGADTWQLTAGTLPAGLSLNATTGLISGTPNTPVTATPLTFKVTDSGSPAQTATSSLTLTIAPATLTITTVSLSTGVVNVSYSQTLAATGGTGAYTWQLTAGTLPAGLSLNASTGLISGTPTTQVTATPLTFKVTDSGSPAQTATANLHPYHCSARADHYHYVAGEWRGRDRVFAGSAGGRRHYAFQLGTDQRHLAFGLVAESVHRRDQRHSGSRGQPLPRSRSR